MAQGISGSVVAPKASGNHSTTSDSSNAPFAALQKVNATLKGDGEDSLCKNSDFQAFFYRVPLLALDEALERVALPSDGSPLVVADLGSSSGPDAIANVAHIFDNLRRRLPAGTECQGYFNDLPSNDFNTLFQLLSNDARAKSFRAVGVPGSFYDRLLPRSSVHVFHTINSLHWMSKIPDAVIENESPAYNSGQISYLHSRTALGKVYQQHALLDLKNFFQSRATELVSGGLLFAVFFARETSESQKGEGDLLEQFCSVLNEILSGLVKEGLLTEQQHDTLDVAICWRSLDDVRDALACCGSMFEVAIMKAHKVDMAEAFQAAGPGLPQTLKGTFRAVFGSPLETHLGEEVTNVIWQRYDKLLEDNVVRPEFVKLCILSLIRN